MYYREALPFQDKNKRRRTCLFRWVNNTYVCASDCRLYSAQQWQEKRNVS